MAIPTEKPAPMSFDDALEKLGISGFKERIFNSNSHGELFHLMDYIKIAEFLDEENATKFADIFKKNVEMAEKTWSRPESVFQYPIKMLG